MTRDSEFDGAVRAFEGLRAHLEAVPRDCELLQILCEEGFGASIGRWVPMSAPPAVFERLFLDLARVDFAWLRRLRSDVLAAPTDGSGGVPELAPFPYAELSGAGIGDLASRGEADLVSGRWGVVIFAGGAATRFWAGASGHPQARAILSRYGGNAPKGLFPVAPLTGRSFLDLFAEQMLQSGRRHGRMAPLVLMAGRATRDALLEWVETSLPEGFDRSLVKVMVQADHPRLDMDGHLLIRADGSLVFTGDGHGGVFKALLDPEYGDGGVAGWLRGLGVRSIVLHNVDNVAAMALEPARLGFHARGGFSMTMSAVLRVDPLEKVGIIAMNRVTGRVEVVEYSVCPVQTATAVDAAGRLLLVPAHINTNLVELDAVRPDLPPTLYGGKEVDIGGRLVRACSHEMLNQSLAGLLEPSRVGVLVLERDRYFQPTKSLDGVDSLVTTREWLGRRGID
ncbi:MAG TPA: UTP--glucose-1-phosphate uridylyltransferase [Myxococcota bacterium]|nr:UTP--glucose-1-phosphate uridylyltransferase [Myxococcota bacterium]